MGLWQTGYLEHHELPDLESYALTVLPPQRYSCCDCVCDFETLRQLYEHQLATHPVATPTIWIRGRQLDARVFHVSMPLRADEIDLRNVSECEVNGKKLLVSKLHTRLTIATHETLNLCIENKGIKRTHQINYWIADPIDVKRIEQSFVEIASQGSLSRLAIDGFIKVTAPYVTAPQYRNGICQYLYGVLAKDGARDSNIPMDRYLEKLNSAVDSLADFDTILSRAIRSLISFHYNRYRDSQILTPDTLVGRVANLFLETLLAGKADFRLGIDDSNPLFSFLYIDRESMDIFQIARQRAEDMAMNADLIYEKALRTNNGLDRMKLAILAAEAYCLRGDSKSRNYVTAICRPYLHDLDIGDWAQGRIQK